MKRNNVAGPYEARVALEILRVDCAPRLNVKLKNNALTAEAVQRNFIKRRSIVVEMSWRIDMCAGVHDHFKARDVDWVLRKSHEMLEARRREHVRARHMHADGMR